MDPKKIIFDAIKENDVNSVKDLISRIDTLDFINTDINETPLIFASRHGRNGIVMILLNAGASINFANYAGSTALMYAVDYNNIKTVQILLNANINLQTGDGETPLMRAAEKGHKKIVFALINAGADINIRRKRL